MVKIKTAHFTSQYMISDILLIETILTSTVKDFAKFEPSQSRRAVIDGKFCIDILRDKYRGNIDISTLTVDTMKTIYICVIQIGIMVLCMLVLHITNTRN